MKNLKIILLSIMSLVVLSACGVEEKNKESTIEFVKYDGNYAIYVSHEEKSYYKVYLNEYEQDFQKESFESIEKMYEKKGTPLFEPYVMYVEVDGEEKRIRKYE